MRGYSWNLVLLDVKEQACSKARATFLLSCLYVWLPYMVSVEAISLWICISPIVTAAERKCASSRLCQKGPSDVSPWQAMLCLGSPKDKGCSQWPSLGPCGVRRGFTAWLWELCKWRKGESRFQSHHRITRVFMWVLYPHVQHHHGSHSSKMVSNSIGFTQWWAFKVSSFVVNLFDNWHLR